MALYVKKKSQGTLKSAVIDSVLQVRGGVSVKVSGIPGEVLFAGTPLTEPSSGICEAIRCASFKSTPGESDTGIKLPLNAYIEKGAEIKTVGKAGASDFTSVSLKVTNISVLTDGLNVTVEKAAGETAMSLWTGAVGVVYKEDADKTAFAVAGETVQGGKDNVGNIFCSAILQGSVVKGIYPDKFLPSGIVAY